MGEMQPKSDAQLLREYAESGSESAFTELVTRHTDLVYSAALRQVPSSDLACDVAQNVFTGLARSARTLTGKLNPDASLAGWLCRCTRNQALNLRRDDFRRHSRERQAMETLHPSIETAPDWDRLRPLLDQAISGLNEADHDALVLRYFKNQDLCSVGLALGVSDDTAQKRVARALEKMREYLAHHGITTTGAALALAISANAVQAAPVGLAVTISTAAVLAGTTFATTTTATAIKTIAMTTLQKTIITAALATAVGTGIFEAHQASQLRDQLQTLQKQQAPLTEQLAQLQAENKQLSNLVAQAKDQKSLSQAQFNELLKLRGQTGQTRTALQELAKLKSSAAQQSGTIPAFLTNAMAQGMSMAEKSNKKVALAKLDRMKEKLHLTDDQAQAISDIMVKNIENSSQQVLNAMQGKQQMPPQDQATLSALQNEEAAIKALLTPDQLAVYPDFKQAETITSAKNSAQADLTMMTSEMDLSQEQQDKVNSALYQLNLDQASALQKNQEAIAQARATGKFPDFFHLQIETQKQTLENKLKALDGILTPEQLKTYEQKQLDMIDMQTSAMKMFLPQTTNGVAQ
jgi:RNA polymerase sigma factor (sigma-70 family)